MKKCYNFLIKSHPFFKSFTVLMLLLAVLIFQNVCAQSLSAPNLKFVKNTFTASDHTKAIGAEGSFVFKDGLLDEVKSFSLKMSLTPKNIFLNEDAIIESLDFKLTHVMVLPHMKMIHIVGILDIAGVSKRTEFDFNYIINEDQSLSLLAKKSIKMSDFNKNAKLSTSNLKHKTESEINLNLNLLFKKEGFDYIASN